MLRIIPPNMDRIPRGRDPRVHSYTSNQPHGSGSVCFSENITRKGTLYNNVCINVQSIAYIYCAPQACIEIMHHDAKDAT